jgi:hypothetical protein
MTNLSRFHVVTADDQHRGDAQLFSVENLRLGRRRAEIRIQKKGSAIRAFVQQKKALPSDYF